MIKPPSIQSSLGSSSQGIDDRVSTFRDFTARIADHLKTHFGFRRVVLRDPPLGAGFGLSTVAQADCVDAENRQSAFVVRTAAPGPFGLEYPEDCFRPLYRSFRAAHHVAGSARVLYFGAVTDDGQLLEVKTGVHFFLVEEFVDGTLYGHDFVQLRDVIDDVRLQRECDIAERLARQLAETHRAASRQDSILYRRALRDLIGSGEGVIGLLDGYPSGLSDQMRRLYDNLEYACLRSVQKHRHRHHRLRRTHGDFHPWNILLTASDEPISIDQSRTEWNDPAIDVGAMLMNYLLAGIWSGNVTTSQATIVARRFLRAYLKDTDDEEILEVLPVFTAVHAAAAASPTFYPECPEHVHRAAVAGAIAMCAFDRFDADLNNVVGMLSNERMKEKIWTAAALC